MIDPEKNRLRRGGVDTWMTGQPRQDIGQRAIAEPARDALL